MHTDAPLPPVPTPPSRSRLIGATVGALLLATLLLFAIVLPAEYGYDPLGTGEALGLVVLADPTPGEIPIRPDGLSAQAVGYRVDRRTFEIPNGDYVEYKFRLEAGEGMLYSWSSDAPVRVEMHSEADGAPEGTAEFFEVRDGAMEGHGSYLAPFSGDHGWYWRNSSGRPLTLVLHAAGFFDDSIEYRPRVDPILRDTELTPEGALGVDPSE